MTNHQKFILTSLITTSLLIGCANKNEIYKPYAVSEDPNIIYSCHTDKDLAETKYLELVSWEHLASPRNIDILTENSRLLKIDRDKYYSILLCYQKKKEQALSRNYKKE